MAVLLLALVLFAFTEWLPLLLFLPAAGAALLLHASGPSTTGRTRDGDRSPRP
jgi:hypothetical protein